MKLYISYIVFIIGLSGCVEPYDFKVTETAEILVVDAIFTDEQKAHTVRLSLSGALDSEESKPVSGATLWILEEGTDQIDLTEVSPGLYQTDSTVKGIPGKSYTLFITLEDGTSYKSSNETLPAPIAIDDVYGSYFEIPSSENDEILKGIQFFLDTQDEKNDFSNFRYEYEEDFEVRVPYPSLFEWNDTTETYKPRDFSVGVCYAHEDSKDLIIATTNGLSSNQLSEFPIRLVSQDQAQLNYRYSITIRQHAITSTAYQYYKNLKENNESSGSFFDKQKGTIPGNISDPTDASKIVLGYFEVSGVSTQTDFFVPDEFEDEGFEPLDPRRFDCNYIEVSDSIPTVNLNNSALSGRNIYEFTFPIPDIAILVTKLCSDCRYYGDLQKPDFWD